MRNALILQAARFGDLVQTRRLALSVQADFNAHLCVDASLAPLASILYPGMTIHSACFHGSPDMEKMRLNRDVFAKLREINFERVYNLNFSPLTADICRMFKPENVVGYRPAHNSMGGILRSPWARLAFRLSVMRGASPLNLVDFWGFMSSTPIAPQKINPVAKGGGKGLGIALSGREARRSLPIRVLAEVARIAFNLMGKPEIRLFGSAAERQAGKKLKHLFPMAMAEKTIDLSGRTDWGALVGELSGLDLLITPDTGLMHLGAYLGIPVMAFFLSSAWCHETGPYGEGHLVWQAVTPCSPCLESRECPWGTICLEPFSSPDFGRILAQPLNGRLDVKLPDNLQLYQSSLDGLGGRMTLVAGNDRFLRRRLATRSLLASWLGIADFPDCLEDIDQSAQRELVNELFPPNEWMLPEERYC